MTGFRRRTVTTVVAFLIMLGVTVATATPVQAIEWGPFGASLYVSCGGSTSYWRNFPSPAGLKTYLGKPLASKARMGSYHRYVLRSGQMSPYSHDVDAVWLQPGAHRVRYRVRYYVGENPSGYGDWAYGPWNAWFTVNAGKYGAAWKLTQFRVYEYCTTSSRF